MQHHPTAHCIKIKYLTKIYFFVAALFALQLFKYNRSFAQITNYTAENFTIEDGLPNNLVEDIEWDTNNILWISTLKGIGRFDGKWMQPFSLQNGDIIKTDYCGPFFKNEKELLFFGDTWGNIYSIKKNRPHIVDSSFQATTKELNPRVLQLPTIFWPNFYKVNNAYFKYRDGSSPIIINNQKILIAEIEKLSIYDRIKDEYHLINTFSSKVTLFKLNNNSFVYEKNKLVNKIDFSNEMDIAFSRVEINFSLLNADIFWRTGMSNAIMIQGANCWLLEFEKGQIKRTPLCNNIPPNITVTSIKYNEKLGVLAIGTDGNGVYIIRKKAFKSYIDNTSVLSASHSYYSQLEFSPNNLLLTYNNILELNTGKYKPQNIIPQFRNCFKVKDSIVFFSDFKSQVFSWLYKQKKLIYRKSLQSFESSAFATTQNRVFHASDDRIIEFTPTKDSIIYCTNINKKSLAKDMIEYKPGYLVFAGSKGMYGFDINTKKLDTLSPPNKLIFRGLTVYKDYIFVAAYGAGIFIYKDKKLKSMPIDIHKNILDAHNIYIDKYNYAWISTNTGIFKTKANALINYFNDTTLYVGYEFFGKDDGIDVAELNGGCQGALTVLKNGNLSYAGINGIVTVDVDATIPKKISSYIFADKMVVNDSLIYQQPQNNIQLAANTKKLKFYFVLPLWDNSKNEIIEYKVDGYHNKWEILNYTKQNFIELINIPDGDYTLSLKLSSIYDKETINTYTLNFSIDAPWYKTKKAIVASSILIFFAVWGISAWRNQFLKQRNKMLTAKVNEQIHEINTQKDQLKEQIFQMETYQQKLEKDYALKNRLISMIGHDMITPLRFMSDAGKKLVNNKHQISPETYDDIVRTMVQTGNNLKDMSTNMLNWIRHHSDNVKFTTQTFNLFDTVEHVVKNVSPMSSFKNITIYNNADTHVELNQYTEPLKNILFQILSNAIKYCDGGNIYITSTQQNNTISLIIKDEGPGMTEQQIQHLTNAERSGTFTSTHDNKGHGFGYLIIKDMLEIIKANIFITGEKDKGTTIQINLPTNIIIT